MLKEICIDDSYVILNMDETVDVDVNLLYNIKQMKQATHFYMCAWSWWNFCRHEHMSLIGVVIFSHRHQWIWTFCKNFRKIWKRILISLRFRGLKVSKIEKKSNFFLIATSERWKSSVSLRRNYHFWTPKNALPESKGL